ncbi:MAG TPA: DinB family protein [Vicinamibacterales bacterium]|nr:DinB family protein [Vicinamibacterales bacterium]
MRYMKLNRQDRQALVGRLAAMPDFLEVTFAGFDQAEAVERGQHGEPSPVEQCWHLADLEREGYGVRIRRLLDEPNPMLPDFDGTQVARERNYRARPLSAAIIAFREARAANLAALRQVEAGDWLRAGVQEGVGPVALCDIPAMMDEHDEAHRSEIEAWLRARR